MRIVKGGVILEKKIIIWLGKGSKKNKVIFIFWSRGNLKHSYSNLSKSEQISISDYKIHKHSLNQYVKVFYGIPLRSTSISIELSLFHTDIK